MILPAMTRGDRWTTALQRLGEAGKDWRHRLTRWKIYEERVRGPLIRRWKFAIRQDLYPDRVWHTAKQKAATSFEVAAFFTTWWRIREEQLTTLVIVASHKNQ